MKNKIEQIYGLKFRNAAITYAGVKPRSVSDEEISGFRQNFLVEDGAPVLLLQAFTAHKLKAEGAKLMIRALKLIKNRYSRIILIITRKGGYSTELKEFTQRQGIHNSVVFIEDVDNPYIPLSICDIVVHTPLGEGGVSYAILKAMIMGKSILATSVGGIPEAIKDMQNGILVEPDMDKIAKGLYSC